MNTIYEMATINASSYQMRAEPVKMEIDFTISKKIDKSISAVPN